MSKEIPNDFDGFFVAHPDIRALFFNGKKAEKLFNSLVEPLHLACVEGMHIQLLPSTSPANAKGGFEAKLEAWKAILNYVQH